MALPRPLIVLSVILAACLPLCLTIRQQITLYDSDDESGEAVIISSKLPNLSSVCFSKRTNYVCSSGIWILYQFTDYDFEGENAVIEGDNVCIQSDIPNGYESVRYLGASETSTQALSLYEEKYGSGAEHLFTLVATDGAVFPAASLAITGRTNWTLYTEPDFQGTSYCVLSSQEYTYLGNWGNQLPSQVASVLKGCDRKADITFTLPLRKQNIHKLSL